MSTPRRITYAIPSALDQGRASAPNTGLGQPHPSWQRSPTDIAPKHHSISKHSPFDGWFDARQPPVDAVAPAGRASTGTNPLRLLPPHISLIMIVVAGRAGPELQPPTPKQQRPPQRQSKQGPKPAVPGQHPLTPHSIDQNR